ncbi:RdgB/HAM1 family non-canonical purine NTP pyrophosphatase [Deinococcus roseus]|uniref:dITP/XTP pyrophosphatase n=1 Tax=Deinococcus roseus TaxID=392414 RepID=A0ABQ2CUJ8_9DEIO|nr:RdgB/HAM1 family non-canonical purine NTP pyrophosphatase [Deinococcus roseus]GGJ21957.1 non-canonical purine NTP pyrophosphatase [Deinococcus roseus]
MQVIVATGNPGKVKEIGLALQPLGWDALSLKAFAVEMPEETETTYEGNALLKSRAICDATGIAALADDSGLEVEALDNVPGVYSARYGNLNNDQERYEFLLNNLGSNQNRRAKFVSVVVISYPDGKDEFYRGEVQGFITREPRGAGGFGYDPIFFVPEFGCTMAELTPEEKQSISHRGRALKALLQAHS